MHAMHVLNLREADHREFSASETSAVVFTDPYDASHVYVCVCVQRKASQAAPPEEPSYKLNFVHYPIVDLGVPTEEQLAPFVEDLARRLEEGKRRVHKAKGTLPGEVLTNAAHDMHALSAQVSAPYVHALWVRTPAWAPCWAAQSLCASVL